MNVGATPSSPPRPSARGRTGKAGGPCTGAILPSILRLLHALVFAALVVWQCVASFPLAQAWRRTAADASAAGSPSDSPLASREADALWWLSLIAAIALLLFLLLGVVARLVLALLPSSSPPPPPTQQQGAFAATAATPARPRRGAHRLRRLLVAAAWLPAAVIAAAEFARLAVLASGNNKTRSGGLEDCAAGPSPQAETREAFRPASPGGLAAPACDKFRTAVLLAAATLALVLLSLLWRSTPRRALSRLLLAPALSVAAVALLLAKPASSLALFAYVQREAFSRGGDGASGWSGEVIVALISLLLAAAGAAHALWALLAVGPLWHLCAAAERRLFGHRAEESLGGERRGWRAAGEERRARPAWQGEDEAGRAPAGAAAGPEPRSYARPSSPLYSPRPPGRHRRVGGAGGLLASLAAFFALLLVGLQLPAAFGLLAPVVALASYGNLWSNFWVVLDFALGIAGFALFLLAVVVGVVAGRAAVRKQEAAAAAAAAEEEEEEGGEAPAVV